MNKNISRTLICLLGYAFFVGCSTPKTESVATDDSSRQPQNQQTNLGADSGWRPQDACAYLSHVSGLQTRGYKNQYEDTFGCSSPYKELGGANPPPNSIAYYVGGNSKNANELKLVLNVNDTHRAKEAHLALLENSEDLTRRALGVPIPKAASSAISAGKAGKWTVARTQVELVRENWASGKGYELKYILRR